MTAVQEDKMWVVLQRLGVIQDTELQAVCLYLVETCLMCHIMHVSLQSILYDDVWLKPNRIWNNVWLTRHNINVI